MSREAKMERNRIRLQERRKQNRARKAEGQKDPAPDAGGKSKGAEQKIMRYPLSMIDSSTDYLKIQIQEYKSKGNAKGSILEGVEDLEYLENGQIKRDIGSVAKSFSSNVLGGLTQQSVIQRGSDVKTQYTVTLPIPNNITDSNSVSWGEDTINPLQAAGMNVIGGVAEDGISALGGAMNELINTVPSGAADQKKAIIAAIAAFGVGANPEAVVSRATGQILNPNLELLFSGVNLRAFSFMFDFAPRSYDEGQMVKQIIRTFKKTMVPSSAGGIFVKPPSVYQLMYMQGASAHPFLNSFQPCALVNMDINYTGSGTYATYRDGTPVHMQLQLTFKELNPIYGQNYSDQQTNVGY
jgi:hypothetical protein